MAGYRLSSFFACLRSKTESSSINSQQHLVKNPYISDFDEPVSASEKIFCTGHSA